MTMIILSTYRSYARDANFAAVFSSAGILKCLFGDVQNLTRMVRILRKIIDIGFFFFKSDIRFSLEFTKIAVATGAGFLVMGFIGFFVKLM